jgi:tetratricopeptide (TPR) repeat protein
LYRNILGTYPDDIDAWIQLGEVLFHYGPVQGRSVAESRVPFERVLYFDPGYVSAMVHLARIAVVEGRRRAVDSLVGLILKLSPTGDRELEMRVLRAYALGDVSAQQRALPELGRVADGILPLALWEVGVFAGDLDGATVIARVLTDPMRSRDARATGHVTLAYFALAGGRLAAARAELTRAAATDSVRALEYGTLFELAPFVEPRRESLEAARRALQRLDSDAVRASGQPTVYFIVHDGVHGVLRTYLLGVLSARLGDFAAAERHAVTLAQQQGPPTAAAMPRDFALEVRAEVAMAHRSPATAVALLRGRTGESWYEYNFASPFFSGSRGRYLRAGLEAAAAKGEDDVRRAITLFSAFEGYSAFDLIYAGPSHLRRGALYERLGDRPAAASHYARFLTLWKDCDPEFRPLLDSARAGYERATSSR